MHDDDVEQNYSKGTPARTSMSVLLFILSPAATNVPTFEYKQV